MASPAFDPTNTASARAAANRENAQHSTGPRTSDGKERVRLNALKHGLFSTTVVLPYEDAAVFEALREKITDLYIPASDEQHELLNAFIETQWRLNRVLSIEGNLYAVGIREELEPATTSSKTTIAKPTSPLPALALTANRRAPSINFIVRKCASAASLTGR